MKNLILYSAVIGSLGVVGCSSAYRTAQTPDDIYFSEGPAQKEVVRTNARAQQEPEGYTSYWEKQDDDMLRMKVNDRNRWSQVDDIDYWQGYNNNYWVNYNTGFHSPWGMGMGMGMNSWNQMNMWNSPWGMNHWNSPWGMNAWNSPWGMNNGFNSGWGFNMGMGGFGFNRGLGFNSWNNGWNNPYCWNRPVTIINKYPVGSSRNASSLTPYSNYNYNRGSNTNSNMRTRNNVSPGASRSIWDSGSGATQSGNSRNNMYRSVERSGNSNDSYSRPVRTFDGGGSSGGSRSSGGSSSSGGGSSSGGSRGGRGG